MPYHAMVVFTSGYDFLFKSTLGHCVEDRMNCNNSYHIESEKVKTCLNIFENHMNRCNSYHIESEQV